MMASFHGLGKLSGFGGNFDRGDHLPPLFVAEGSIGPDRNIGVTTGTLRRIAGLYVFEAEFGESRPDERKEAPQARWRRLLDDLEHWLRATQGKLS